MDLISILCFLAWYLSAFFWHVVITICFLTHLKIVKNAMPLARNGNEGLFEAESFFKVTYWIANIGNEGRGFPETQRFWIYLYKKKQSLHFWPLENWIWCLHVSPLFPWKFCSGELGSIITWQCCGNFSLAILLSSQFDAIESSDRPIFRVSPSHQHSTRV